MSTNTSNMSMGKAVDGDNAKTYLETTLAAALDKIDAHDHSGTTHALAVLNTATINNSGTVTSTNVSATGLSGTTTTAGVLAVTSNVGFYGQTPQAKQVCGGSRASGAALVNLLICLSNIGLLTDSTTA